MSVEASIVVPIILLSIIALLYLPIFLYKQVCTQALANQAANRSYVILRNKNGDIETGKVSREKVMDESLYRRIYDFERENRIEIIEDYIESKSEKTMDFFDNKEEIKVALKDYIIYKEMQISLEETYINPLGNLLKIFGVEKESILASKSNAVIYDPAEFIRNTDLIIDIKADIEREYSQVKDISNKIKEAVEEIKEMVKSMGR